MTHIIHYATVFLSIFMQSSFKNFIQFLCKAFEPFFLLDNIITCNRKFELIWFRSDREKKLIARQPRLVPELLILTRARSKFKPPFYIIWCSKMMSPIKAWNWNILTPNKPMPFEFCSGQLTLTMITWKPSSWTHDMIELFCKSIWVI